MIPKEINRIIQSTTLGSKEIAIAILEKGLDLNRETLISIFRRAFERHPSMNILRSIADELERTSITPKELLDKLRRLDLDIARNMVKILDKDSSIVSYSRSSTLINVFRYLHKWGYLKEILLSEARPNYEGVSYAEALADEGIEVTLVIDIYLPTLIEMADYVIVGCDTILPDNTVINKVGSKTLAIAAKYFGKDFIVACDQYKFSDKPTIDIEEGPSKEIYSRKHRRISVKNPYFEPIPPKLISYIVTNIGIIRPI